MNREEFLRQMGLSNDDVADPELIVANLKEKRLAGGGGAGSAQSSYFSSKVGSKKPFPGYASATPAPAKAPMSEAGQQKYDDYVNRRVDNVVNNRVDDGDDAYMNAPKQQQPSALDRERMRAREEAEAEESSSYAPKQQQQQRRESYADKSDWISRSVSGPQQGSRPSPSAYNDGDDDRGASSYQQQQKKSSGVVEDDTEALYTKKKASATNDNISVAQRIAQASRAFYGAGEGSDDDDGPATARRKQQAPSGGGGSGGQSKAEFLRSLGIDNVESDAPSRGGASSYSSSAAQQQHARSVPAGGDPYGPKVDISASVALTGADRTEALSNAVAARRAARKAAMAAAKANGGGGALEDDGYQPPRSAPSAVDDVSSYSSSAAGPKSIYGGGSSAMPRASSEPSGDQRRTVGGGGDRPRVTITNNVTHVAVPQRTPKAYDDDDDDSVFQRGYASNSKAASSSRVPPELSSSRVANGMQTPTRPSNYSSGRESPKHESPTSVVNELLFGGGGGSGAAAARNYPPPQQAPPSTNYRGGGYDSSSSSLNNTMNSSRGGGGGLGASYGGGGAAEYDPETANLSAEELKTLGNKSFEDGDFRKAVRYYSKAISKDSANPALYSNRSAAYLQASKQMGMDTRSMALRDAEKTIELSPKWFKGYSRKGDALFKLERYDDAIDAYEMGLAYDEGNPSLMHSIGEARNAHGGIARRDKKDTPWSIEQRTNVDVKKDFGNKSAHELMDMNRGALNDALGTLVMGDDYRRQQLERFRSSSNVRASGTTASRPAAPGGSSGGGGGGGGYAAGGGASTATTASGGGGGKSLLDMIRSNSPKEMGIPMQGYGGGGAEYGRRAGGRGGEPLPEQLTSQAAVDYQDQMMERYLARKAAKGTH